MANIYQVELHYQGSQYNLSVPGDQTILAAAQAAGIDMPFSCSSGVCTTCAAQVLAGSLNQSDGMGVSPALQAQGYALLCVSYPLSDLKIEADKEDTVYHLQFGQFQQGRSK